MFFISTSTSTARSRSVMAVSSSSSPRPPLGGAGQLPQLGDAAARTPGDEDVAGAGAPRRRRGRSIQSLPRRSATTRMPTSVGSSSVGQAPLRHGRVLPHPDPVGDLLSGGQVGHQGVGDAQPVGDDARHVDGGVAHPLDGRHDAAVRRPSPRRRGGTGPASTQTARISWTSEVSRSSSSTTSSAMAGSAKNSAAYPRSTISSEVSFASESMALRFRGRSSIGCAAPQDTNGRCPAPRWCRP